MTTIAPSTALKMAHAVFLKESRNAPEQDLVGTIAEFMPSDYASEDYAWVGEAPRMQLLEDELRTENLTDASYSIENNTYAIGIDVKRRDLRLDRIGGIMKRVQGMVRVAQRHPNRLLIAALESGTTDLGFDGSAFFANAHADRSGLNGVGTQDNLLSGSGLTEANIQTDLTAGIQYLAEVQAENGEPLHEGIGQLVVVAPWGARTAFENVLGSQAAIIGNTTSVAVQSMDIRRIYSARLTDANDWYLLHISGGLMPLIFQQLDGISFETLAEGSDQWVKQEKATFKVRWDGAVGYGHFGNACKFVN